LKPLHLHHANHANICKHLQTIFIHFQCKGVSEFSVWQEFWEDPHGEAAVIILESTEVVNPGMQMFANVNAVLQLV
jgi:hypothetical protein